MIPAIVTSVEDMIRKWEEYESKEVDLFKEFFVLASDMISKTAFSSSYMQGKYVFIKLGKLTRIVARNADIVHFKFLRWICLLYVCCLRFNFFYCSIFHNHSDFPIHAHFEES